ncbi:hypothetical protein CXB51_010220 [Gossypium anomalum]|uniref:Rad60/SUMO-like domain-containing protein n=1 Tax=Gossypium anomalum TaxID=47600 RepID=A0A8J5YMT9_9ROSI|nr:hypothetical protein CXB51_010220 [Gossypium anomalum]
MPRSAAAGSGGGDDKALTTADGQSQIIQVCVKSQKLKQLCVFLGFTGFTENIGYEYGDVSETMYSDTLFSSDGNKVVYNIKRNAKLIKLMHAYCRKKQLDIHTVRFIYEGHRVPGKCTSDQLNLEDGAEICCMFHQAGGGVCSMPKITSAFI